MRENIKIRSELIRVVIIILLLTLIVGLIGEVDRLRRFIWGVEEGVSYLDLEMEGYLKSEVRKIVISTSSEMISYPRSARLDPQTGEIIPEKEGKIPAVTETVEKVMEADPDSEVSPVMYKLLPYLRDEEIREVDTPLDSYSTLITGGAGRRKNIRLATQFINNTLVLPGEVFSFNKEVGPRTEKQGFSEAPELVDGELTSGIGGGICQVSSTLYNAVDPAGLKIIERHSHSGGVSYVPEGKDATVAWNILDFKFRNEFSAPVIVRAWLEGGKLKVTILGTEEGKSESEEK